jgi:hypothetical protein
MTAQQLQAYLQSEKPLTLGKVKNIIYEHIMSLIPETIDTDAGTHIYLLYQERLKIAEAVTDGLVRPFQVYNLQMEEFMDKLTTIDMPLVVLEQIRELEEEVYGKA